MITAKHIYVKIFAGCCAILTLPLIATLTVSDFNWQLADFVIMGGMLFFITSALVFVLRRTDKRYESWFVAAAILLFIWLWAELGVGVFTNWGS